MRIIHCALAGLALFLIGVSCFGQDFPKPGPEHEWLKQFEGTWEATSKMSMAPGQTPVESKGVEVSKLGLSGFWLTSDFKGDMFGMTFLGHSVKGYDTIKKKYVGVWIDNMGSWMMVSEGDLDKSGKVLTEISGGYDMAGKPTKYRMVTEIKDKDTHTMTMSWPVDGKEHAGLVVTYKRKK